MSLNNLLVGGTPQQYGSFNIEVGESSAQNIRRDSSRRFKQICIAGAGLVITGGALAIHALASSLFNGRIENGDIITYPSESFKEFCAGLGIVAPGLFALGFGLGGLRQNRH